LYFVSPEAAKTAERREARSFRVAALYELHAPPAGRLAYLLTGMPTWLRLSRRRHLFG
jgi:hypothetical protein